MLLAERAGRELEPPSNLGPRGMTVIAVGLAWQGNRIRPIGLLHSPDKASLVRLFCRCLAFAIFVADMPAVLRSRVKAAY
jgi:hypothetical protein